LKKRKTAKSAGVHWKHYRFPNSRIHNFGRAKIGNKEREPWAPRPRSNDGFGRKFTDLQPTELWLYAFNSQ